MYNNRFIVGIPEERRAWLRIIGTQNLEVISPLHRGEYLACIANLDIEILTTSLCAMSFGITIQEDSAEIHAVQDTRCAPLVVVPPLDRPTGDLQFVKEGDSTTIIQESANYAIAKHKWSRVFDALRLWISDNNSEYRIGFNCNWVDFRPQNETEEMAVVLAFLEVFSQYKDLFL